MGLFSGITDSLFGKGGSGTAQQAVDRARELAPDIRFKSYGVTSSLGGTQYDPTTGQVTSSLNPAMQGIQTSALGGAQNLFNQASSFDAGQRSQDIYNEQLALMQPAFEQQRQQMQQDLFGSGRLGMRLASGAAGAGEGGGMVQPDAFGLGLAQQQTMAGLAADARGQALGEQAQLQDLATGMLSAGMSPAQLELELMSAGLNQEIARSGAQQGAAQTELMPYDSLANQQSASRGQNASFFGSLVGGFL